MSNKLSLTDRIIIGYINLFVISPTIIIFSFFVEYYENVLWLIGAYIAFVIIPMSLDHVEKVYTKR